MKERTPRFADAAIAAAAAALKRLKEDYPDFVGAVISTSDGHIVADILPSDWRKSDVAAMASALAGLAETIASRTQMGGNANVVIENDGGKMIVRRVNEGLTLTTVGRTSSNLGMQLSVGRRCVDELRDLKVHDINNKQEVGNG